MSSFPSISALYVAVLGFLGAGLTINVIVNRVHDKVDAGDGGVTTLAQAIRAHANFVEVLFRLTKRNFCIGKNPQHGDFTTEAWNRSYRSYLVTEAGVRGALESLVKPPEPLTE